MNVKAFLEAANSPSMSHIEATRSRDQIESSRCDDYSNFHAQICISEIISVLVISRKNASGNAAGNARRFRQEGEVNIRH
jgi:hypothetical protein